MELIQQFDLLASSLGGVAKLRELILSLAVRGKLVPQDPADEPASVLLKTIRAEKERLIAEGKIKKDKPLAPISSDEKPFELPERWEWVRLADIAAVLNGKAYKQHELLEAGTPVLRVGNLFTSSHWYYSDLKLEEDKYCDMGDLLFAWSASFGPFIWPGPKAIYHYHIWKLNLHSATHFNKQYLYTFLQEKTQELKAGGHGVSMVHMTKDSMEKTLLPVPPLPEQSRIVAKVGELMALCDRLEAEQGQAARVQGHCVEAALAQLADSADADDFARHWQHLAQHFDTLFTTPDSITQLEATLLQLAVRGKLVPQDPNDEPASTLLQKIRTEKDRLIAEGKIKRDKPLKSPLPPFAKGGDVVAAAITSHHPPLQKGGRGGFTHAISDEQAPLELPEGWEWVRLGDLLPDFQNGASSRGDNGGINTTVLRLADIRNGEICLNDTREIPINRDHIEKYSLKAGDVLITRVNGSADLIGRFTLALEDLDAIYCDHFIRMRIDNCVITPQFLKILGDSQLIRDRISSLFITTAGQKTVNQGHISSLQLPLAPFAEQSRIVAKLESLFALTAGLKAQLAQAQKTQALLADVLLETSI